MDEGGVLSPLLDADEVHLKCCVQYWSPQNERDVGILECVQ